MKWYCAQCWGEWGEGLTRCPLCEAARGDEEGFIQRLIAGLRSDTASVVQHAANILGERREQQAVAELVRVMDISADEFVLEAAARGLGKIGDRSAVAPLCRMVRSGPRAAREAASVALARLHATEALPLLREVDTSLGACGLGAIEYLDGRRAEPPADASSRWASRPALGGDPTALVRSGIHLPGCVVCALMSEDLNAFLAQWQYFSALAPAIRERFCERRGFCPEHLNPLGRIASQQSLDVSLSELVARLADGIASLHEDPTRFTGSVAEDALAGREDRCQACGLCSEAESLYIRALATLIQDDSFRESYAQGRGVCIPHFLCLRSAVEDRGLREWIEAVQQRHLRRLVDEMRSHLRKCRQRLRRDTTRDEEQAAWRALRVLSGESGVKAGISRCPADGLQGAGC
jgi:hypothetical protein